MKLFFENTDGRKLGIDMDLKEYITNYTEEARQCMPPDHIYAKVSNIDEILKALEEQGFVYSDEWIREYVFSAK